MNGLELQGGIWRIRRNKPYGKSPIRADWQGVPAIRLLKQAPEPLGRETLCKPNYTSKALPFSRILRTAGPVAKGPNW